MASLDDLKKRIASVKSTQKITKAMKMVATIFIALVIFCVDFTLAILFFRSSKLAINY